MLPDRGRTDLGFDVADDRRVAGTWLCCDQFNWWYVRAVIGRFRVRVPAPAHSTIRRSRTGSVTCANVGGRGVILDSVTLVSGFRVTNGVMGRKGRTPSVGCLARGTSWCSAARHAVLYPGAPATLMDALTAPAHRCHARRATGHLDELRCSRAGQVAGGVCRSTPQRTEGGVGGWRSCGSRGRRV